MEQQTGDWADYTYVVKENPHDLGNWYLECSPRTRQLDCIDDRRAELQLHLPRGTTEERAREIRRFAQENIPIIRVAHFR